MPPRIAESTTCEWVLVTEDGGGEEERGREREREGRRRGKSRD